MTEEDKRLLLQDLCARLPYNVKVKHLLDTYPSDLLCIDAEKNVVYVNHYGSEGKYKIECIRPYLRPMRSMTEGERRTYKELSSNFGFTEFHKASAILVGWLNQKMLDYRHLIPNGLALEAPEGMYNS